MSLKYEPSSEPEEEEEEEEEEVNSRKGPRGPDTPL